MNSQKKIVTIASLKRPIRQWRRKKKKIAFTNGCFDILHFGHVSYLEKAKGHDRILILGLNSDASVRKIKGPQRPINPEKERAAVLAALTCVDYVVIFNEDTPYQLIKAVQPDILIKGADWKGKEVACSDIVRERGGKVEFIAYVPQFSTTKLIEAISEKCRE